MDTAPHIAISPNLPTNPELGAEGIFQAVRGDVLNSPDRLRAMASLAGVAAVEAVGITRLPSILALPTAIKIQKETGLPPVAGLGAGAGYGAWTYLSARALDNGTKYLPRTFAAVNDRLPCADNAFNVLPGLEPAESQPLSTHASRGAAVYTAGTGLYVVGAALQNQSPAERRKLTGNLGKDGGAFLGVLATTATAAMFAVQQQDPELAKTIVDHAGSSSFMLKAFVGLAALKVTSKWSLNKARQKLGKIEKPAEEQFEPELLPVASPQLVIKNA